MYTICALVIILQEQHKYKRKTHSDSTTGCVSFCPWARIPGYPSEYLLTITEPTASSTGVGAKFSEAIKFTQRRCLGKQVIVARDSRGGVGGF